MSKAKTQTLKLKLDTDSFALSGHALEDDYSINDFIEYEQMVVKMIEEPIDEDDEAAADERAFAREMFISDMMYFIESLVI